MNNEFFQRIAKGVKSIVDIVNPDVLKKKQTEVEKQLTVLQDNKTLWTKASVEFAKDLYVTGRHKELAVILPHLRHNENNFIKELLSSRLLTLGKFFEMEGGKDKYDTLTFGADPEFILEDANGEIVLFSSDIARGNIVLSEATIGADYGLMEFRPAHAYNPKGLLENLKRIHEDFEENFKKVFIKKSEAVVYLHKMARIRAQLDDNQVDFGLNPRILKGYTQEIDINLDDESTYFNATLSAFDEPLFKPSRDDLLTAGGHIHIGGSFIRMLSLPQTKRYVRLIDAEVSSICQSVETPAAKLRNEAYGFPGEFRIKPYGLEYRTPSNAIFWNNPKSIQALDKVLVIMANTAMTLLLEDV